MPLSTKALPNPTREFPQDNLPFPGAGKERTNINKSEVQEKQEEDDKADDIADEGHLRRERCEINAIYT